MRNALKRITIVLILLFPGHFINAQISSQNLQNVNVDDLSDDQIQKYVEQAAASGYSTQQLEVMAKARGMSEANLEKLRQRINQLKSSFSSNTSAKDINRLREQSELLDEDEKSLIGSADLNPFDAFSNDTDVKDGELPYYGMDFFKSSSSTFAPSLNVPTPKNYLLGPGDQVVIDVWGASEQTYQLEISPDGNIIIPNLGPIFLNGLDVNQADLRIKSRLKKIYSTLGENTFSQLSLGQLRTINVHVVGEVKKPGTYQLSSFATVLNALYSAQGPIESGTLRDIQIFRNGSLFSTIDLYDFLIYGKVENTKLMDEDIILVKPYLNRVSIEGEIKRPAFYEIRDGENFQNLLDFAGGFTSSAFTKNISFQRNLDNQKTVISLKKEEFGSELLKSGDKIVVSPIRDLFINRVTIEGAVNHSGEYSIESNLKLSQLIRMADGFSPDVFLNRAVVIRQNPDFTLTTISFSPRELLAGNYDLELKSEDIVKISTIFDLREDWTVSIQGEVQVPGDYTYSENMTIEDLVFLADGFKETAAKSFVEVARRINSKVENENKIADLYTFSISEDLKIDEQDAKFVLKPFDLIVIRKSPYYLEQEVVEIEGEVLYPGKYVLNSKTERISDLIKRAGGFTKEAFPSGGSLIRETEYYDEGSAALVKKLRIQALDNQDSTALKGTFDINRAEGIAIELNKIAKNPGGKEDIILRDGDIISIPKELQTVRVRGEVYFSSNVVYEPTFSLRYFVNMSGGFTEKAKKSKAYVVYANGSAQRTKNFLWFNDFPKVEPGAEIIIPRKPDRRRLSPGEVISLATGVGTLAIIINNLTK